MRRLDRSLATTTLAGAAAAVLALGLTAPTAFAADGSSSSAADAGALADVSPYLARTLTGLTGQSTVLVHGTDLAAAADAVRAAGLTKVTSFSKIGVVAARGTKAQIEGVRAQDGVTYVEAGEQPIQFLDATSNTATRGLEAQQTLTGADGSPLTGKGVSVGVIDSGVDPTHPAFREADGSSAVVANLKTLCEPTETLCTVQRVPGVVDTDTLSAGGHGTHVNGIVAGRPTTLADGQEVQGAAKDAKLVSVSTGAALVILGADAALNWVLENHEAPCGAGVPASTCPPIKVTNNSYGPTGGGGFDPQSATVKLQRALADEGVLTVWANGNDGGDGSENLSNPPGQDPTPGVLSVASYFDLDNGTRDGKVSDYSSRGLAGDQSTYPDFSAPGENITSACRPYLPICSTGLDPVNGPGPLDIGTFNTISGTSMAAPHVAGIVAQLFQANPQATPAQIEDALKTTAHKYADGAPYEAGALGTTSVDKGYGLVDVVAAAEAVR
ncbi:serine protease AprX [Nocardioides scoriae]|uniref:Serine protease AprX n=1 Tax=Nocardioides scoriae TaxID=642780 RepID=A0A1H1PQM0_9ACTN|nr:S8 family serine peptidase [Nocardioides scoriae]SDS13393.1 serine protease AprX [Nocardioides scoriae]